MSQERHRGGPPQGKPPSASAISGSELRALTNRIEGLEKIVKEYLDEKNQWNSLAREWVGKVVLVQLIDSSQVQGVLRWIDRYTMCIEKEELGPLIVHKGAIAYIRQI